MSDAAPAALEVSAIAFTLKNFSRQPVADQARQKAQLEAAVALAVQPLRLEDRVVLDSPDGLVVAVLGDAEHALQVAERGQVTCSGVPVCIALNYGPVKIVREPAGREELIGDGIVAAITLANLATRGRLLASRAFRDALAAAAPHRASELAAAGAFTDAEVRSHELFTIDPAARPARRRRFMLMGGAAALGLMAAGVSARMIRSASRRPAVIAFEVSPNGDIYVDGQLRGETPPLARLEIAPGPHTIEVRNDPHPPLRLELTLQPGEEIRVKHAFAGARKGDRKTRKDRKDDSYIGELRRRLGI